MIQSSFQLTSMNDHFTFLISQQFQFYSLDNSAANNALPKCGQDDETSAAATLQVRFGAGPFTFKLIGKFNFTFSI